MERIDKIVKHSLFLYHLKGNETAEVQRCFCLHNMAHFLDVARIASIINLEENIGVDKEWIYAAALLHDLGKHIQYEQGIPHEIASARIAPEILMDCGFNEEERAVITDAILSHRDASAAKEQNLKGILYRGDKASRACFACKAEEACNWKDGKKNLQIKY